MRRVYPIAGTSLLLLSIFVGQLLASGLANKAPPKKAAPAPHKVVKPAAKPKPHPAPKPHAPPKKAAPKVAHAAKKPVARPAVPKPKGPVHHGGSIPHTTRSTQMVHTHQKAVNGVAKHTVKSSRGTREWHSYHFSEFHKEKGEYSFHSHWWRSFVSSPASGGWSGWQATTGEMAPPDEMPVPGGSTALNVAAPTVIKGNQGLPLSREGRALAATLDGMDVEHHWRADGRVDWRSGNTVDENEEGTWSNSGAFVAAVGARFKLPMPSPDEVNFLPQNQYDWLLFDGKPKGWIALGEVEAQLLANQGWIVIAAWKNPAAAGERQTAGVVAVVRPDNKPVGEVASAGPTVTLAGQQNLKSVPLGKAFPASARQNSEIVFLAHRPH